MQDEQFKQRAQLILGALLAVCGNALRTELQQQMALMEQLSVVADRIKTVKDVGRLVGFRRSHRHKNGSYFPYCLQNDLN